MVGLGQEELIGEGRDGAEEEQGRALLAVEDK
jgi:hypothetical protein